MSEPRTLIERLQDVVARLEAIEDARQQETELLSFKATVTVLLDDGRVKLHSWYGSAGRFHVAEDFCPVMTQEEYRFQLENPAPMASVR